MVIEVNHPGRRRVQAPQPCRPRPGLLNPDGNLLLLAHSGRSSYCHFLFLDSVLEASSGAVVASSLPQPHYKTASELPGYSKNVSAPGFEQMIKCFIACAMQTRPHPTYIHTKQHMPFPFSHLLISVSFYWDIFSAAWLQLCVGLWIIALVGFLLVWPNLSHQFNIQLKKYSN